MIPDVYAKLSSDDKKMWAGAIAMSHFLARIECGAPDSLAFHCESISAKRSHGALLHMGLKFDGAEIPLSPRHGDFNSTSEIEIKENMDPMLRRSGQRACFPPNKAHRAPFL